MAAEPVSFGCLVKTDKDFDACRFRRDEADPEQFEIMFLTFTDQGSCKFEPHPECDGFRYMILLCSNSEEELGLYELEYFEAYLGDPLRYVKANIRSGFEGFIVKKCQQGFEILDKILTNYPDSLILKELRKSFNC